MKQAFRSWRWSVVGTPAVAAMTMAVGSMLASGMVLAQQSPANPSNAQIDAGEPRADTSSPSAGSSTSAANPSDSSKDSSRPASAAGTTAVASSAHGSGRQTVAKAPGSKGPGGADHVDLGMATVTGDREQPKVMYIVPWKQSDIGNLSGKPMNSLLDEALAPVDRDEFKREVVYYDAVKTPQNGASNTSSKQGEK